MSFLYSFFKKKKRSNRIIVFTVLIFMNRVSYGLIEHILCSKYTHSVHTNGLIQAIRCE